MNPSPTAHLDRRNFIEKSALGAAALATLRPLSARASDEAPSRPNIILITCHDLGRHLGCYGVKSVDSPNLDALAAEGVRFAESFCVAPQCSPSRAAMTTGQYPHTNGVMGLSHADFGWSLKPESRHIASLMREAGWHTALAGGQHETHDPTTLAFDELSSEGKYRPCQLVAGQCVDFLARRQRSEQPFYLQVGFYEPHRPFDFGGAQPDSSRGITVPPYLVDDAGSREECAAIQGAIRAVDNAIGRVLTALNEHGLRDNTLLIFTTDHGIAFPRAKCAVYDPGLATCLLMRWPAAHWPTEKSVVPTIISNVDYLPTILELAGVPIPAQVQGRSFAALLQGKSYTARGEIFAELTYHDYCDPRRCVRTARHKLILNFTNSYFFMDPSQEWYRHTVTKDPADPSKAYHPPLELYDLQADPAEIVNLASSPAHQSIQQDLLAKLGHWMRTTQDPLLAGIPPSPMHERGMAALAGAAGRRV